MSILNNSNAISGGGYNLENSLRFRSSASAYLSRTPGTAGNRKTFTYSAWVKRGTLGVVQSILSVGVVTASNPRVDWQFNASNSLEIDMNSSGTSWDCLVTTTQVFRDPSAWYHIVVAIDTTQATAANRVKIYVNGEQVTSLSSTTYPALNADMPINNTLPHALNGYIVAGIQYIDGYLTEINFVDGQALTPSDFGETNATTGVWQPIEYTGTYGTNGFYLPMNQTVETYNISYVIVAGGGSGGGASAANTGGGGAGGYRSSYASESSGGGASTLTPIVGLPGTTYTITVGAGAPSNNTNGSDSSIVGGADSISCTGGGAGGHTPALAAGTGGSGGGRCSGATYAGGGAVGQGYNGGLSDASNGGGGGGAAEEGSTDSMGFGGDGVTSYITGSGVTRAGGGGGGGTGAGTGGDGGGGDGGTGTGANGSVNTGGGGGGQVTVTSSALGGSGVVILSMPDASYSGTTTGSPTVATGVSGNTVLTFNSSGSYTA